ncbi:MAG: hypothetical protein H8E22_03640 [Candidatus Cloacimonetes bacterium]|nr:hypothetical protein [Candidatus Cloacimonadota bacterium]
MSNDIWPFANPRVSGINEHHKRIQTFLELARDSKDPNTIFRLHIACIYFARGIIELIFEAADKEQISSSREQLKETLPAKLRWYNLIERIRIHDFHRFGIIPPNPDVKIFFQGGPIKLKAKNGTAAYSIMPKGPKIETTGDSSVKQQRPLITDDGRFFDEDTETIVTLENILKDFLLDVPKVIKEFEQQNG